MPKRRRSSTSGPPAKRARKAVYRRRKMYRSTKSKSRGALVPLIKRTIIRMAEPKNKPYHHGKIELYHNSGQLVGPRILPTVIQLDGAGCMPTQGDSDTQRNGDQIYTKGISVRMLLGQKQDRMNVTYRILVIRVNPQGEPSDIGSLFDNVSQNVLLDYCNTDRYQVAYQKFIKKIISPQIGNAQRELTFTHKFWLPMKRTIKFRQDGVTEYSGYRHYMYVFAYDAFGTATTNNIAYVETISNLYFADP